MEVGVILSGIIFFDWVDVKFWLLGCVFEIVCFVVVRDGGLMMFSVGLDLEIRSGLVVVCLWSLFLVFFLVLWIDGDRCCLEFFDIFIVVKFGLFSGGSVFLLIGFLYFSFV